ncbi:MAG: putative toxin-antitoxin system toxin component, PIN family [Gemmatimonadetes bacterium]|nr:putative toxin-antitoxin system toxin component, PIN family [Gemmatimonadota bacterium]
MKVCLDTNVLVSAFATRGLASDVLRVVLAEHELLVPTVVLEEVERVLRDKFRAAPPALSLARQVLASQTVVPRPATVLALPIRDPDDAWVLASAVAGGADLLVTGDADLLTAAGQSPIPVLSPRAFWEQLRTT